MPSIRQGPVYEDEHPRPGLRFLVDNSFPHWLIPRPQPAFPRSVHVSASPLNQNSSGLEIRRHAGDPGRTILIKDNDFDRLCQRPAMNPMPGPPFGWHDDRQAPPEN